MKNKKYNSGIDPARKKAIDILESIAEYLCDEKIFDCRNGDTRWYDLEDIVIDIIKRK